MIIKKYDRIAAAGFAEKWALGRSPDYFDFSDIGGDCTNFVSQCIYAGCGIMNFTPVSGWFYTGSNNRSASWTSVKYLHSFLTENKGAGPFAVETNDANILPGDIIQLADRQLEFYHSLVALGRQENEIFVAAHSLDSLWRPLSSYDYHTARFLHISAARF